MTTTDTIVLPPGNDPVHPNLPAPAGSANSIVGLEHLALDISAQPGAVKQGTAVLYLRVSTVRQLNTGADVDEDGNSIATQ